MASGSRLCASAALGRLRRALLLTFLALAALALVTVGLSRQSPAAAGAAPPADSPVSSPAPALNPVQPPFSAWDEEARQPVWHEDIGIGR